MEDIKISSIAGQSMIPQVAGGKKIRTEIANDSETENEKNQKSVSEETVDFEKMIDDANKIAKTANKDIHFQINEDGEPPIIIVTDKQTGKIIRQIPSEEMLRLSDRMEEFIGLIYNGRI